MSRFLVLTFLCAVFLKFLPESSASTPCRGCITLDELGFSKISDKFEVVLVKFDVAYPYGERHDVFKEVCEELMDNSLIICSEVGVKDYGEKDNEEFAMKYGVNSKDDLPSIRVFVQGEDEPFAFHNKMPWTSDNLKKFIRDHTSIYLGLPGCLERFDKLAMKFMVAGDKHDVLVEAQKASARLSNQNEMRMANIYVKFMKKVIDNGVSFLKEEVARLKKIINEGKVTTNKKEDMQHRLNILKSFEPAPVKTEL